jgi:hypothetical protein
VTRRFRIDGSPLAADKPRRIAMECQKKRLGSRLRSAGVSFEDRRDLLWHLSGRIAAHYSAAELSRLNEASDHNPTGGAMVVELPLRLLVICEPGIMMTLDRFQRRKWTEEVPEAATTFVLILIALHLCSVSIAGSVHRESLPTSMFAGRKRS